MTRYFFAFTILVTSLLITGCINSLKRDRNLENKPNIVILYADDMGYGDLGVQNPDSKIPTPNLDRLASEGIRFTDGHSSSGICTPSRYALLTGRYHWRKFHDIVNSFENPVINTARLTLPEMLKSAGYRTACIGKWHLGWNWPIIRPPTQKTIQWNREVAYYAPEDIDWTKSITGGPLDHGFDYYFGDDVPNFPPYTWIENDRVVKIPTLPLTENPPTAEGEWEARPGPMAEGWRMDAVMPTLTEKAVQWIDAQKDKDGPFFLYFPFTSPHAPIVPAKEFIGKSQADGYGDFVLQTDHTVGEVLKALEQNGFRDNTLVIFTSDNGPERYAYERIRNFNHRSMGPLRGLKRDIWEGGHRVPLIIRWTDKIPGNQVNHSLFSQIDIMATLAFIIRIDLPPEAAEDSYDLSGIIFGNNQRKDIRRTLVHNTFENHYAIRHDDWLLINAPSGTVTKEPEWFLEANCYVENQYEKALFNLKEDLSQQNNIFAENPDQAIPLENLLQQIREQGYSAPRLSED